MHALGVTVDQPSTTVQGRVLTRAPLIDQVHARAALAAAADQAATLIRSLPDPSRPIPKSAWTVGEAAAHLVIGLRLYTEIATGQPSPITDLGALAHFNAQGLRAFPERRPDVLADELADAARAFLAATADRPGDALVRWHADHPLDLSAMTCLLLGEILVHGHDIAAAQATPWPISPDQARLVIAGLTQILPLFVNAQTTQRVRAGYEIRIRGGGPCFVCRFAEGGLDIEAVPAESVDCRISADPVAFLLVGYGRVGQWGPITRGQMAAWGRKPWLAFGFKHLLRNP